MPGLRPTKRSGRKANGSRVDVVAVMQQQDADQHRAAGRHAVLAELPRHRDAPPDERDHRARAHRLVDGGLDVAVGIVVRASDVAQPVVGGRVAQEPLECPGERVGGRLVAGEHQREQLVAQLLVGQALAVLRLGARAAARGCRSAARAAARRALITAYMWRSSWLRNRRVGPTGSSLPRLSSSTSCASGRVDRATGAPDRLPQAVLGGALGRACPRCRRSRP